jgi:peptidoglycan/LPS O-acetylase OafA/YrhL
VFGISSFGSARQLWALPPFWWLYMLFGWLVLSKRDLKKKYLYYLILAPIIIIMILICLGFNSFNKIQFSFMWFLGVAFVLLLNKFNSYIQEKETKESPKSKENVLKTKKTVKYISLLISIGLFVSAFIRLYFHQNPFGIIYYLLLVGAVLFILVGSQYANFTYPKKMRRIIKFLANYSLTLYLLHFSLCNLLLGINDIFNDIFSFIVLYVIANIASIGVAYVSEMRSDKFYNFLQRKFNLN